MKEESVCQVCFGLQLHTRKVDSHTRTADALAIIWESLDHTEHPDIRALTTPLARHLAVKERSIHKRDLLSTLIGHIKIHGHVTLFTCYLITVPKVTRASHNLAVQKFLDQNLIIKDRVNIR